MNMLLIYILTLFFYPLLPDSRSITSCHMMFHVTLVTYLFNLQKIKEKKKSSQRK